MNLTDNDIIYEDNHLIVVNKPAGILTQGDSSGEENLLDITKSYIKNKYNKPGNVYLGMVQRLDKPVSGVIAFAKTSKAAARLCDNIKTHKTDKIYISITKYSKNLDKFKNWKKIEGYISRTRDKSYIHKDKNPNGQLALLELKSIYNNKEFAINLIKLITGRKHQIRAQFSNLNIPIIGDVKYGSNISFKKNRILLHAIFSKMIHPVSKENIFFRTNIPDYFLTCFNDDEINSISKNLNIELNEIIINQ